MISESGLYQRTLLQVRLPDEGVDSGEDRPANSQALQPDGGGCAPDDLVDSPTER